MVQWLGLCTPNAGSPGSNPGWGTKIPQDTCSLPPTKIFLIKNNKEDAKVDQCPFGTKLSAEMPTQQPYKLPKDKDVVLRSVWGHYGYFKCEKPTVGGC